MSSRHALRYAYLTRRRQRARHNTGGQWALFSITLLLFFTVVATAVSAGGVFYAQVTTSEPAAAQVIASRGGGAKIYDRNGTLLYQFLNQDYGLQERVKLDQVSPWMINATIATEDDTFYSNPGVNIQGLTRAMLDNLRPGSFLEGRGGSSITQQLVKQLYFDPKQQQERSFTRKFKEAALAIELTREEDKNQILEWYFNEIPYGGVFRGVQSASQGYFGVDASQLSLGQAAVLAGIPQSPERYDPFSDLPAAVARGHEVLDLMVRHGMLDEQTANWAKLEQITLNPRPEPFLAPHFVNYVGDYIKRTLGEDALYKGGLEVHTTLDLPLQIKANVALEKYLDQYETSSGGHNGAVVVIDPPTGQILVMVGSRDYNREDIDGTVNNALAINSPGSTLKPFTYVTAFEQGWGPDWPIVDTPITYKESDGSTFSPRNPDGRTRGVIPLKQALGNSFNIPAFKTILWAGVDNVVNTAKSMGITTLDRDLGPALTLGGVDVSLLDVTYGYSVFANNGVQAGVPTTLALPPGNRELDPNPVLFVENQKHEVLLDNRQPKIKFVIRPEYAYMITDILSNDDNRAITYGHGSNLNIPGHKVAAKTGTSEPYTDTKKLIGDTWTYGYTPDMAVGVWVGNTDNKPMVNILSTTIAGSTWHDVMVAALEGHPALDWVKPDGLVNTKVCVPSGIVYKPGMNCRTVQGTFALDALSKQDAQWWGGEKLQAAIDPRNGYNTIPEQIQGWKRYLAQEYQRYYGNQPAPRPAPTPAANQPPPADNNGGAPGDGGGGGNGNGNGNGRRR